MLATSIAYYVVVDRVLHWPKLRSMSLLVAFVFVDGSFVIAAGLPKFIDGGWVPFAVATVLSFASFVWLRGRRRVVAAIMAQSTPVTDVIEAFRHERAPNAPAMVFLTPDEGRIPFIANRAWIRDRAHAEHVVVLRLQRGANPTVREDQRVNVGRITPSLTRIVATFGYMEPPRIAPIVDAACEQGIDLERDDTSFFYRIRRSKIRGAARAASRSASSSSCSGARVRCPTT